MLLQTINRVFPFFEKDENSNDGSSFSIIEFQKISFVFILFLALSFIGAGIVFFFAYNWQAKPVIVKFTLVQSLFCLGVFGAYKFGLQSKVGKLSLTFASLLVGVFMAVFGQIYQTGADSYQLFATWSVAILPFVLLSNFSILWILYLLLLNLTCFLSWDTFFGYLNNDYLYMAATFLNLFFLATREWFINKYSWLNNNLTRLVPYSIAQFYIFSQLVYQIDEGSNGIFTLLSIALTVLLFLIYRYRLKDLVMIVINLTSIVCILTYLIVQNIQINIVFFSFLTIFVISCFLGITKYIGMLYREFKRIDQNTIDTKEESIEHATVAIEKEKVKQNMTIDEKKIVITPRKGSEKNLINPSNIRDSLCFISAMISDAVLISFFLFFFETLGTIESSYFFLINGVVALTFSIYLFRWYNTEVKTRGKNIFVSLYTSLTALGIGYFLITIHLTLTEFEIFEYACVFTVLTAIIYPFTHSNIARAFIILFTIILISWGFFEMPFWFMLWTILELTVMTLAYLLENKYNSLSLISKIFFVNFTLKIFLMLSEIGEYLFYTNYYKDFSLVMAFWIGIIYLFYTRKIENFWKNLNLTKTVVHLLALACIALFAYYNAYAVLYLIGMIILSLCIKKLSLLRSCIYISFPLLSFYYYYLDITLLYKSYTLLASGAVLLLFTAYNKEVLIDEK